MIEEKLGREWLFFDGGMGTLLQERGLASGELPETWNILHPEVVEEIHKAYVEAGCHILLTNTFGANPLKFHHPEISLEETVGEAVRLARQAAREAGRETSVSVALDLGPTGKLLEPMGDLHFEEAVEAFRQVVEMGVRAGCDLIHIETMNDTYELKAAVVAAKEACTLPVFATAVFDERAKLLTGGDVASVVALLEGLRVDALGINCSLGPEQMLPVVREMLSYSSLPVIVKPNAGLPQQVDGRTCYQVTPAAFARSMVSMAQAGACLLGGCCGTTPDHLRQMIQEVEKLPFTPPKPKERTLVCGYGNGVELGKGSKIIGERINPTGKKRVAQALREGDTDFLLREALSQEEEGAHILDVNVGLPEVDEPETLRRSVQALQEVTSLPLQIDTADPAAMEQALRIYNGKPLLNSVSGKQESMDRVFPLVQKYGGVVVALTLDEKGIPDTAQGRVEIADKILREAQKYGIQKKDILVDVLTMTISSDPRAGEVTLEALSRVHRELGVGTVLGVSNISFGLPRRPILNGAFYTMAMDRGLSAAILNPASQEMQQAFHAFHALQGLDENCEGYIAKYAGTSAPQASSQGKAAGLPSPGEEGGKGDLDHMIQRGLREEARERAAQLLETRKPLDIIDTYLVPALDTVGKRFEEGTLFLPQLLQSAEAAKGAFEVLREALEKAGEKEAKEKIILATVKGDIHDIGKNIVKVLMENYGFEVLDLGRDVAPETILAAVKKENVRLVGLSALMTTTVPSMAATISLLHEEVPQCKVLVGGAVLNPAYAKQIGADFYGKDAMQSVHYAQSQAFGTSGKTGEK